MFELAICIFLSCRVFQIETIATSRPPSFTWLSFVEKSLRSIGSKHIFMLCLNITAQKEGESIRRNPHNDELDQLHHLVFPKKTPCTKAGAGMLSEIYA